MQLEVIKASSGGKVVQIADSFGEPDRKKIDQSFLDEIVEAIFRFKDQTGISPDIKLSSGQGLAAPFLPPEADGAFVTPKRKVSRSIKKDIEVKKKNERDKL